MVELQQKFATSERRACGVLNIPRSTQRYIVRPRTDEVAICQRLRAMVRQRPRFGYRRLTQLLKREGWTVNSKRIHRLCRSEGLKVRQAMRNKRAIGVSANACDVRKAEHKDHVWTWDFVFDKTTSGTAIKWLSLVDEHTRECLALKVDRRLTSEDVIRLWPNSLRREVFPGAFVVTMVPSLSRRRFACGWDDWGSRSSTSPPAAPGRMATSRASTRSFVTSSSTASCSRT